MEKKFLKIDNIHTVIWGKKSLKCYIAVHGNMSNKEDIVIQILADIATSKGYQVISFDLPEHGERGNDKTYLCNPQNCIKDLKKVLEYVNLNYNKTNIFACSMGAYFSILAYQGKNIETSLFLSPIVNMKVLIDNMMTWANVNENILAQRKIIETDFGQTLYFDYYKYVKENPIKVWKSNTFILRGSNDNMQSKDLIDDFASINECKIQVLEGGEHFFHTEEQLKCFKNWINSIII